MGKEKRHAKQAQAWRLASRGAQVLPLAFDGQLAGFGHSRPVGLVELVRHLPRAVDELRGFAALLRAMA